MARSEVCLEIICPRPSTSPSAPPSFRNCSLLVEPAPAGENTWTMRRSELKLDRAKQSNPQPKTVFKINGLLQMRMYVGAELTYSIGPQIITA